MRPPSQPKIADCQYVIMQDDVDMLALESLLGDTPKNLFHFRSKIDRLLTEIIDMCYVLASAEMQIEMYINKLVCYLPRTPKNPYAFIVNSHGDVDVTDIRSDKRTVKNIVFSLANNIRRQLEANNLYDEYGILQFQLDSHLRTGSSSLEIRLKRV